jgi:hypothetical protein
MDHGAIHLPINPKVEGGQTILPFAHGLTSRHPASFSSDIASIAINDPPRAPRRHIHLYPYSSGHSAYDTYDSEPRALVPWPQWPSRTPRCQRRSSESPLATLYLSPHHKKHKSEISFTKKFEKSAPMRSKARPPPPPPTSPLQPPHQAMNTTNKNPSIRRMRPRPHIHRLLRLPRRTPLHEQLHEAARHTIRARRSTRGMVCPTNRAPARTRAKSQSRTGPGGVYEGVVGVTRARAVVETEGDGEEGGEDTWTYGEG